MTVTKWENTKKILNLADVICEWCLAPLPSLQLQLPFRRLRGPPLIRRQTKKNASKSLMAFSTQILLLDSYAAQSECFGLALEYPQKAPCQTL